MAEPEPLDLQRLRILLAADNAHQRRLVQDLLIALNAPTPLVAENAIAAFAALKARRPDLIIADADMKPMNGLTLTREIRACPLPARDRPIVLFTHEASPDFAEAARALGATAVLAKPISPLALKDCLRAALAAKQALDLPTPRPARLDEPAPPPCLAGPTRMIILGALSEAALAVERWATSGDTAHLAGAVGAASRAHDAASDADGDLRDALAAALRLLGSARNGLADPRLIQVSLEAARAVLSAPKARAAMRQALSEAVSEMATKRSFSKS